MVWCETGKPDLAYAKAFAEAIHRKFPGKLLAYNCSPQLQLEEEPRRRDDRQVPARARRDGLQVPVHHAGGLPQPQLLDVQSRARLRAQQHERLRRAAGSRVRGRGEGLHRGQAPARGRHRLLRRRDDDDRARRRRRPRSRARPKTSSSSTASTPDRPLPAAQATGGPLSCFARRLAVGRFCFRRRTSTGWNSAESAPVAAAASAAAAAARSTNGSASTRKK